MLIHQPGLHRHDMQFNVADPIEGSLHGCVAFCALQHIDWHLAGGLGIIFKEGFPPGDNTHGFPPGGYTHHQHEVDERQQGPAPASRATSGRADPDRNSMEA